MTATLARDRGRHKQRITSCKSDKDSMLKMKTIHWHALTKQVIAEEPACHASGHRCHHHLQIAKGDDKDDRKKKKKIQCFFFVQTSCVPV